MTDPIAPESANEYRAARSAKAAALTAAGVDPFGARFTPTHTVAQARALAPAAVGPEVPSDQRPMGPVVTLAGRIGNLRRSGKNLVFATLYDRSRAEVYLSQKAAGVADLEAADVKKERGIQLFLESKTLGEQFALIDHFDLADWLGVTGAVGRTKTGEISIFVKSLTPLGKSMLPPPHQAGAGDTLATETRSRQRYLDLLTSDASLATFMTRSKLVSGIRQFFTGHGYLEVETPMLHPIPGGATARPFVTHHNALDMDLYLRIAPELYLKRLIVGGMERVFEINRNFRNEGISPRHNPEFTMIEWYEAYADHEKMMELSEELFRHLADTILGTRILKFGQWEIDLNKPFRRLSYADALPEYGGFAYDDKEKVIAKARELGLKLDEYPTYDRLANEVWEEVVEPELFGHDKGAFTGAAASRAGWFEQADSGTLFLDEIGELPLALQAKLLRTLQEGTLVRLGGRREVKVNVRLVAATHRDLAHEVQAGRFRQDLYYRLNVIPIRLPSLAERREDIRALALHLVSRANQAHQRNVYLTAQALARLEDHPWPGNIRELGNVIERLVLLSDDPQITPARLERFLPAAAGAVDALRPPAVAAEPRPDHAPDHAPAPATAAPLVREYMPAHSHSMQALQAALQAHQGNQSRAAQALGLTLRQFGYRLRKAGLR